MLDQGRPLALDQVLWVILVMVKWLVREWCRGCGDLSGCQMVISHRLVGSTITVVVVALAKWECRPDLPVIRRIPSILIQTILVVSGEPSVVRQLLKPECIFLPTDHWVPVVTLFAEPIEVVHGQGGI